MTVATIINRAAYTGNGATTSFSYPYPVQDETDLVVVETVIATGVDTVKTLTTHYTVTIAGGGGSATVDAVTAPANTEAKFSDELRRRLFREYLSDVDVLADFGIDFDDHTNACRVMDWQDEDTRR